MTTPLEVTDADDDADVDVSNKVEQTKVDESPKVDEKSNSVENDESAVRYIQVTVSTVSSDRHTGRQTHKQT